MHRDEWDDEDAEPGMYTRSETMKPKLLSIQI